MPHGPCNSERFVLPFAIDTDNAKLLKGLVLGNIGSAACSAKTSDHIVILIFSRGGSDKEHLAEWSAGLREQRLSGSLEKKLKALLVSTACYTHTWESKNSKALRCLAPAYRCDTLNEQPRHESTTEANNDFSDYNNRNWQRELEEENDDPTIAADFAKLDAMIDHWMTSTRPVLLGTAARQSLLRNVRQYREGRTSSPRNRALFRFFQARAAADYLAQELADAADIALPGTSCANFREKDGMEKQRGLHFYSFSWGLLAPRDDIVIDRLRHPYRRAAQWLLVSWAKSGKDAEVLHRIIRDANAWSSAIDIHLNYFTSD
ncbi:hypothetical protein BDP27DRAFT_1438597 [Rhodocollybia butyracea]|uniref:Uncharacterized protein n=1 Tax=Rhodocollybia butyracea TaxID=206335 RepID=A0A9P5P157_9AGAR|nr:hypothetical protein BDP27DRAFT_1438597 [Rhodocollybia butyracea]